MRAFPALHGELCAPSYVRLRRLIDSHNSNDSPSAVVCLQNKVLSHMHALICTLHVTGSKLQPLLLRTPHAQGYTMSTPAVTRDSSQAQFKLDLKAAMQTAGIEGTPTVFYVEDHQVKRHVNAFLPNNKHCVLL